MVVFAVVLPALLLFVTEPVPIDITAIALVVVLVVLEPWTTITPTDGLSGFASSATITALAMFILSEGFAGSVSSNSSATESSPEAPTSPRLSSAASSICQPRC